MEITVNGEKQKLDRSMTVSELLAKLDIDPEMVVIELNLDILDKATHSDKAIQEGDSIEIIRMVDGG